MLRRCVLPKPKRFNLWIFSDVDGNPERKEQESSKQGSFYQQDVLEVRFVLFLHLSFSCSFCRGDSVILSKCKVDFIPQSSNAFHLQFCATLHEAKLSIIKMSPTTLSCYSPRFYIIERRSRGRNTVLCFHCIIILHCELILLPRCWNVISTYIWWAPSLTTVLIPLEIQKSREGTTIRKPQLEPFHLLILDGFDRVENAAHGNHS